MLLSHRVHLYPFRTQKLSCAEPKILVWRRTGKIGQCQHKPKCEKRRKKLVLLSHRVHLYPFRTQKLSCAEPKILVWRRTGKIGQCQHFFLLKFVKIRRKWKKFILLLHIYLSFPPLFLNFIYNYIAFLRILYTVV